MLVYVYGLPQHGRAGSGWLAVRYSYVTCHCQTWRLAACLAAWLTDWLACQGGGSWKLPTSNKKKKSPKS